MNDLRLKLTVALESTPPLKDSDVKSILLKEYSNNVALELFFFQSYYCILKDCLVWKQASYFFIS